MKQYQELLQRVLENGMESDDRTGTGTIRVFGERMVFDLSAGFPLVTTKKMFTKGIIHELLWILSGSTNIDPLVEKGVHIWDSWADEKGELGPVYGKMWRDFPTNKRKKQSDGSVVTAFGVDQIATVINQIKSNPSSRRLLVTAWHPGYVSDVKLPACHTLFQFAVMGDRLDCQLYQRSGDLFLGVPFNIASYALLTHMVAQVCGLKPGRFIHTLGDAHIYKNHVEQVKEQLSREALPLPELRLNPEVMDIDSFRFEDIAIQNYRSHAALRGDVSV